MKQVGRSLIPDILILVLVLGGLGYVTVSGAEAMNYQWQWYRIPPFFWRVVDGERAFPARCCAACW
jgi:polar amino acid transport system permease protein